MSTGSSRNWNFLLIHWLLLSSWFGIHGTALNWFKSYLSDRLFCVKCSHDLSKPHESCYGVLQGSVLGPLLFTLYTTPLSSLISSLSLNHHLYADDTQLFISFRPGNFTDNISHLQAAIGSIADWMTSNLLCLNNGKTEFLLLGLKPLRLRLRSSCSCSNTGRRVVSIGHDRWQRSWPHGCHCHWHPFLAF